MEPQEPEVKIQARASTETQGAGTPNISSAGIFAPVKLNHNWILFLDGEIGVNYPDRSDYSSIINTTIGGYTLSTSSRLGARFLSEDRQWMWGVNAGYDSRPITTGAIDHGSYYVTTGRNLFYEQLGGELELQHNNAGITAYANIPIGNKVQALNAYFNGGALETYGLDFGYFLNKTTKATLGYYYQQGDLGTANGSGALASLQWQVANGLYLKGTYSYDNAFESRATAGIEYRFGANQNSREYSAPLQAYLAPPGHRLVRIHDAATDTSDIVDVLEWISDHCQSTTEKLVCVVAGAGAGTFVLYGGAKLIKYLGSKAGQAFRKKFARRTLTEDSDGSDVFDDAASETERAQAAQTQEFLDNQRRINDIPDDIEVNNLQDVLNFKLKGVNNTKRIAQEAIEIEYDLPSESAENITNSAFNFDEEEFNDDDILKGLGNNSGNNPDKGDGDGDGDSDGDTYDEDFFDDL